jgi:uncharacterized membrane protein
LKENNLEEVVLERASEKETSVNELVDQLSRELSLRRSTVARSVRKLLDEGKIRILEEGPYVNLASYVSSPLSVWFWGALIPTVFSLILVFVTSGFALYLRYIFGSLLVLLFPGYSLSEALYPKEELENPIRLALSIGLSLSLVPLASLVLNFTPFGVRLLPMVFSLSGLTLLFLLLALKRKYTLYKLSRGVV